VAGVGDAEKLTITIGQDWTLPAVETGAVEVKIMYDKYAVGAGDPGTIQYRTGADKAACEGAGWNDYIGHFTSLGWVQVKVNVA